METSRRIKHRDSTATMIPLYRQIVESRMDSRQMDLGHRRPQAAFGRPVAAANVDGRLVASLALMASVPLLGRHRLGGEQRLLMDI